MKWDIAPSCLQLRGTTVNCSIKGKETFPQADLLLDLAFHKRQSRRGLLLHWLEMGKQEPCKRCDIIF